MLLKLAVGLGCVVLGTVVFFRDKNGNDARISDHPQNQSHQNLTTAQLQSFDYEQFIPAFEQAKIDLLSIYAQYCCKMQQLLKLEKDEEQRQKDKKKLNLELDEKCRERLPEIVSEYSQTIHSSQPMTKQEARQWLAQIGSKQKNAAIEYWNRFWILKQDFNKKGIVDARDEIALCPESLTREKYLEIYRQSLQELERNSATFMEMQHKFYIKFTGQANLGQVEAHQSMQRCYLKNLLGPDYE